MRWVLLFIIFSCNKDDGKTKQHWGDAADVKANKSDDYIYNVYQFSQELIQDWGETNRARLFTKLKLTANGYPDTVYIAISFDPDEDGEVGDHFKEMEKLRWAVKPMPIKPLPGLYVLPFTFFPLTVGYSVYLSWDHAGRQVGKVMLVIDSGDEEVRYVFAEAERMPYDQAEARAMYLERKTFPAPAAQWSILDLIAFHQLLRLYQLTGSPDEDLEIKEWESILNKESDGKNIERLMGYTDKVVKNFSNTSGIHATEGTKPELKPDGRRN